MGEGETMEAEKKSGFDKNQILLGVLTLVGVLGAAVFANWDKLNSGTRDKPTGGASSPQSGQQINGNNNVQVSGSNIVVNPPPVPRPCRDRTHGVERYQRTFESEEKSNWMGGGFNPSAWCSQLIDKLRTQDPEGAFEVVAKSEDSHSTCAPFNCPQYQYYCKVRVNTDPLYFEKLSSACK